MEIIGIYDVFEKFFKENKKTENRLFQKRHVCFYIYPEMDNMWFFTWIFRFGLFHVIGNKNGEERETLFEAFARY